MNSNLTIPIANLDFQSPRHLDECWCLVRDVYMYISSRSYSSRFLEKHFRISWHRLSTKSITWNTSNTYSVGHLKSRKNKSLKFNQFALEGSNHNIYLLLFCEREFVEAAPISEQHEILDIRRRAWFVLWIEILVMIAFILHKEFFVEGGWQEELIEAPWSFVAMGLEYWDYYHSHKLAVAAGATEGCGLCLTGVFSSDAGDVFSSEPWWQFNGV